MTQDTHITLTECPRDAFQGFPKFIPTDRKTAYVNRLIKAGVRRIDFGSFVSPKAVPQMADTASLFENMKAPDGMYLIAIIANLRGAEGLVAANQKFGHTGNRKIHAAGFPMSINETFQQRNTNKSLDEAWDELERIHGVCDKNAVDLVVYLSMAFGNPYGEPHSAQRVVEFAKRALDLGAKTVQLADTVGVATADEVGETFSAVRTALPDLHLGVHLHATPQSIRDKVKSALDAGCRVFDSAIGGIGGCPFAEDELVGNMDTLQLLPLLEEFGYKTDYTIDALLDCAAEAQELQRKYGASNDSDH
ncbi:MAG: hydroxymethylglutaryl-CoA lyase [Planctomycetes bacterium]|nr:hydroxymethylglutaryl-CoA lyase [Planctomycetota bacterium]MCA8937341.1 hydroxymethylglutaryl-CoA lyase [Planctomycetota bacterium]